MRSPSIFLTAASETSPKSLQVAEPSSGNRVVAKQLLGHVLLDYGIFMDFGDVLCCGCLAVFFFFFCQPKFVAALQQADGTQQEAGGVFLTGRRVELTRLCKWTKNCKSEWRRLHLVHSGPTVSHCSNGLSGP